MSKQVGVLIKRAEKGADRGRKGWKDGKVILRDDHESMVMLFKDRQWKRRWSGGWDADEFSFGNTKFEREGDIHKGWADQSFKS